MVMGVHLVSVGVGLVSGACALLQSLLAERVRTASIELLFALFSPQTVAVCWVFSFFFLLFFFCLVSPLSVGTTRTSIDAPAARCTGGGETISSSRPADNRQIVLTGLHRRLAIKLHTPAPRWSCRAVPPEMAALQPRNQSRGSRLEAKASSQLASRNQAGRRTVQAQLQHKQGSSAARVSEPLENDC
ncbi:hypothetical protein J3F83DRAFT_258625 [Trichoderma novae-zelandiae]